MANVVVQVFLFLAVGVLLCPAEKSGRQENRPDRDPERIEPKFRHKQVNKIWEKALRKDLHTNKLEDIRKQLKKIDEKYLQLKKDRNSEGLGVDQFREQEMLLDQQLEGVMVQFGIVPARDGTYVNERAGFSDKRVSNLWMSALKNGQFSKEELEILKKDLLEHQRKVEEFQGTMKEHHKATVSENEITDGDKRKDPGERRVVDLDMKLKHRQINQDFQRLSARIIPDEERGGFLDHKVVQLWQEAERSNFTQEELETIREELKEFEMQIQHSDKLHEKVLHAEKDHFKEKSRNDRKNPQLIKEQKSLLQSTREELQSASKKVTDFMRSFKERLGKVGRKQEL